MKKKRSTIIFFVLFCSNLAFSQTELKPYSVEPITVKAKKEIVQTGFSVFEIDSFLLQQHSSGNLSELLQDAGSLYVKSEGRGAYTSISARGQTPDNTELICNGISIKSPLTGVADFSGYSVFFDDNISVYEGTGTLKFASGASGAAIVLAGKTKFDLPLTVSYNQEIGSFSTFGEFLKVEFGKKKTGFRFGAFDSRSKNDFSFVNKQVADIDSATGKLIFPIQKNKNAEYGTQGLAADFFRKTGTHSVLKCINRVNNSQRGVPTLSTNESGEHSIVNRYNELSFQSVQEWKLTRERFSFSALNGLLYQKTLFESQIDVSGIGKLNTIHSKSSFFKSTQKLSSDFRVFRDLIISLESEISNGSVFSKDTVDKSGYEAGQTEISSLLSCFFPLSRSIQIQGFIRQNILNTKFFCPTPALGFEFDIDKRKRFSAGGNMGTNLRMPSLNDRYWKPGGNPDLKEETSFSSEVFATFHTLKQMRQIRFRINFFYIRTKNKIIWLPSIGGWWTAQNIAETRSSGFETKFFSSFFFCSVKSSFDVNYAYTRSINVSGFETENDCSKGKQLPFIPQHVIKTQYSAHVKGFELGGSVIYTGKRFVSSSNEAETINTLSGFTLTSVFLAKSILFKNIEVKMNISVENIFDIEYFSVLQRPMPGRYFSGTCFFILKHISEYQK